MRRRTRFLAYGPMAMLVAAGVLCGVFVDGVAGEVLLMALAVAGLGGALLLVFLEIGYSEDRARAREKGAEERGRRRPARRRRD